ncbi:S-adenosyl-L-methionine-dependent methyltransferase [Mycena epipterygia]|nr:S-adenosyl-L-methionine-dependent methyltransferase [Mycena epipterygia]
MALREYFGGKLCLAPISGTSPSRIIDLGCGSGAWVVQAATEFPTAEVVAVDQSPLPAIPLPQNITFQRADLSQPFPFEDETFDIVHFRMVLMHLTNSKDVLARAGRLVKPGGWLLVEEFDPGGMVATGGPAVSRFVSIFMDLVRGYNGDPEIARNLEPIVQSLGIFSQVNVKRLAIPMSGTSDRAWIDEMENRMGRVYNESVAHLADRFSKRFAAQGITPELAVQCKEELEETYSREFVMNMYFCWAHRT